MVKVDPYAELGYTGPGSAEAEIYDLIQLVLDLEWSGECSSGSGEGACPWCTAPAGLKMHYSGCRVALQLLHKSTYGKVPLSAKKRMEYMAYARWLRERELPLVFEYHGGKLITHPDYKKKSA